MFDQYLIIKISLCESFLRRRKLLKYFSHLIFQNILFLYVGSSFVNFKTKYSQISDRRIFILFQKGRDK